LGYPRVEKELDSWLENLNESQKEMLVKALQEGILLKRTFWKHIKHTRPVTDPQIRELEKMGVKPEDLFEDIQPETLRKAKDYAEFDINRYENCCRALRVENPQRFQSLAEVGECDADGNLREETRRHHLRIGMTLKAFEITLQQLQVPYIPNDPTIKWRSESAKEPEDEPTTEYPFDFWIPLIGKIQIKSATLENPKVSIHLDHFEKRKPHCVIAYQILDMNDTRWLKLSGFMSRSEIKQQYKPFYLVDRPFYSIPIGDFESKHDAKELYGVLLIVRNITRNILGPSD